PSATGSWTKPPSRRRPRREARHFRQDYFGRRHFSFTSVMRGTASPQFSGAQSDRSRIGAEVIMAAAAARQVSPIDFPGAIGPVEILPRPLLELVPTGAGGGEGTKGLVCRWHFDPVERRLVAHWEQRGG